MNNRLSYCGLVDPLITASDKDLPVQKTILLNANHPFVWQKMFVTAAICKQIFGLAPKIWNILGPVKGQAISKTEKDNLQPSKKLK